MKKALLRIIISFLFFQQVLAAEEPERDFKATVKGLNGWEIRDEEFIEETDDRLPLIQERIGGISLQRSRIRRFKVDNEGVDGETNFTVDQFGEETHFIYDPLIQQGYRALTLHIEGEGDPRILPMVSLNPKKPEGFNPLSLENLVEGFQEQLPWVEGVYRGDINGLTVEVFVELFGHPRFGLERLLYGVDKRNQKTGIFADFYVSRGEQRYYLDADPLLERNHNILRVVTSAERPGHVHFQGGRAYKIKDVTREYETVSKELSANWNRLTRDIYQQTRADRTFRIDDILWVEGDLDEGRDYIRENAGRVNSRHIYSDGVGGMFAVLRKNEDWRSDGEDPLAVRIYYQWTPLPYNAEERGLNIVEGVTPAGHWPEGIYERTEHELKDDGDGLAYYSDRWRHIRRGNIVRFRIPTINWLFYETFTFPPFEAAIEEYLSYEFFKGLRIEGPVDWPKLNQLLLEGDFRSLEFEELSGLGFNPKDLGLVPNTGRTSPAFMQIVEGLASSINLHHLYFKKCLIWDITPFIGLIPNLVALKDLRTHKIQDNDSVLPLGIISEPRKRTKRLAAVLGNMPRLQKLEFDMAYTRSNVVYGLIRGGTGGVVVGAIFDLVKMRRGVLEREAMEIINNIARAPQLREIILWDVDLDANRRILLDIFERNYPGIHVEFRNNLEP